MKVKFKKFFQIIIFKEKKQFFVKETKKKSHFATLLFKQRVNLSIAKYQKHCYIDCYCSISQASINLRKRKTLLLDSIKDGAKRNEKQNKKPYEGNGTGSETWSTFIGGGVFSPAWVVLSAFQYPGTI